MSKDKRDDDAKKIVKEETEPTGESDAPGPTPEKPEKPGGFRDLFEDMWSNLEGTVKLTNLSAYSAPSPLSKLLILHPSVDRFRLQNSRFLGHPVNGEVGGSLAIQVRSVFALEFS